MAATFARVQVTVTARVVWRASGGIRARPTCKSNTKGPILNAETRRGLMRGWQVRGRGGRGTGHHRNWTSVGFYVAAFACAPHGPNYGKVALVRMFPMMYVGCMQSLVRQRHRRAEELGCEVRPKTRPGPKTRHLKYKTRHLFWEPPFLRLTGPRV